MALTPWWQHLSQCWIDSLSSKRRPKSLRISTIHAICNTEGCMIMNILRNMIPKPLVKSGLICLCSSSGASCTLASLKSLRKLPVIINMLFSCKIVREQVNKLILYCLSLFISAIAFFNFNYVCILLSKVWAFVIVMLHEIRCGVRRHDSM